VSWRVTIWTRTTFIRVSNWAWYLSPSYFKGGLHTFFFCLNILPYPCYLSLLIRLQKSKENNQILHQEDFYEEYTFNDYREVLARSESKNHTHLLPFIILSVNSVLSSTMFYLYFSNIFKYMQSQFRRDMWHNTWRVINNNQKFIVQWNSEKKNLLSSHASNHNL